MGCYLVVGANSFAALSKRQIHRANKFAPTNMELAAKIQENFEGMGI